MHQRDRFLLLGKLGGAELWWMDLVSRASIWHSGVGVQCSSLFCLDVEAAPVL